MQCYRIARIPNSSVPPVFPPMTNSAKAQAHESHDGLEYATCSHVGLKRTINQDSFASRLAGKSDFADDGHLFVVADGMGAHAAGELASRLAVDEVRNAVGPEEHQQKLKDHFQKANAIIHQRGQSDPQLYNMGTTCSALWLLQDGAMVAHVGDSRVYRCRANHIEQLTFDHSLVWEMRAAGQYSAETTSNIPRNVITRCLGPHPHVEVDLEGPFSVHAGDTFLLCSDGLTGRIEDAELGAALRYLSPVAAAEFLIDLANLRGGHDNITATVVRVFGADLQPTAVAEPSTGEVPTTHPGLWVLAGLGMLVALLAAYLASPFGLVVGVIVVAIAGAAIVSQWTRNRQAKLLGGNAFKAPYAIAGTELSERIVRQFQDTFLECMETGDIGSMDPPVLGEIEEQSVNDPASAREQMQQIRDEARRLRDASC